MQRHTLPALAVVTIAAFASPIGASGPSSPEPPPPMGADEASRLLSGEAARSQLEGQQPRPPLSASPPGAASFLVSEQARQAESVGPPNGGRLRDGVALPLEGRGYQRRVRPRRDRFYGTDETIAQLLYAGERLAAAFPGTAPMLVGDISRAEGGRIRPHRSHQTGRDVDIAYLERGNPKRTAFRRSLPAREIDLEKTWFLMETFLLTGRVEFIFVDHGLLAGLMAQASLSGWSEAGVKALFLTVDAPPRAQPIRHSPGHDSHFHVRFTCPQGDACE